MEHLQLFSSHYTSKLLCLEDTFMACSCDGQKINYFIFKVPRHYFNITTPTAFHITKLGLHVRGEPSGFDNLYEQLLEHAFFFLVNYQHFHIQHSNWVFWGSWTSRNSSCISSEQTSCLQGMRVSYRTGLLQDWEGWPTVEIISLLSIWVFFILGLVLTGRRRF